MCALHRHLLGLLSAALMSGCASLPDDRAWGRDATARPGWGQVAASAAGSVSDPWVWVPLLGAAALQVDDWDRQASDWARERTPVFGSQRRAERWSDGFRDASAYAHYASMAATFSGEGPEWGANKARGVLVDVAAVASTVAATRTMKTTFDRRRPNGHDTESFPSGHSSSSAVHAGLASRNLAFVPVRPGARQALDAGLHALTLGTSWSRVEAGWHYPSDTLVGMALGRFIATFANDAFLEPRRQPASWTVQIYPLMGLRGSQRCEVC
jgi:hypothetical protein